MTDNSPVDIQLSVTADGWPDAASLERLAAVAVAATFAELEIQADGRKELSILFADDEAIRQVNERWRGIDKPTNVLSFPAAGGPLAPVLGDIALAFETVSREAGLEGKPFDHHLNHLIVHGLLHILGYDHRSDEEADEMEAIEIRILERLAIPDPYGMMKHDE
ncbi:MAG: rRNA maturation RNase YbeY [Rhizobiaceae bacterium]